MKKRMAAYQQARLHKDATWDGKFFFGVKTTGIFCRPSCPAPVAKEKNVVYFENLYAALEHGFTPCYRCRPDIEYGQSIRHIEGEENVCKAMERIATGWLNEHSVKELAAELKISERYLRKLFQEVLGTSPNKVAIYQRAIFAKHLILHSQEPFTDIAYASGFSSVRQFNATIKNIFSRAPRDIRKIGSPVANEAKGSFTMHIPCRGKVYFSAMLEFLKPRLIPGVEAVDKTSYTRSFRSGDVQGSFEVRQAQHRKGLDLSIDCTDIRCSLEMYNRVRRMWGVDADMERIEQQLKDDEQLFFPGAERRVPRLPVAFDPFECVVRAILGQQISVKAATTLAARIVEQAGISCVTAQKGIHAHFPNASEFLTLDLAHLGITTARQQTLLAVAKAVVEGRLKLHYNQSMKGFAQSFSSIRGIGEWTVQYVAMRALGMQDCFLATDLGVIKALVQHNGQRHTRKELLALAEDWQPFRSYATLCLWQKEALREQNMEGGIMRLVGSTTLKKKYAQWRCEYCAIILVADQDKIVYLHLETGQGKRTFSLDPAWEEDASSPVLQKAINQLQAYFAGSSAAFTVPLHLEGTEFQKQVWAELIKIPFGVQQSYRDIAEAIGRPKAARAVGAAVGRNPLPLFIPCHRIIGSNGALTGFAHGLAIKEQLLRLEGWEKRK